MSQSLMHGVHQGMKQTCWLSSPAVSKLTDLFIASACLFNLLTGLESKGLIQWLTHRTQTKHNRQQHCIPIVNSSAICTLYPLFEASLHAVRLLIPLEHECTMEQFSSVISSVLVHNTHQVKFSSVLFQTPHQVKFSAVLLKPTSSQIQFSTCSQHTSSQIHFSTGSQYASSQIQFSTGSQHTSSQRNPGATKTDAKLNFLIQLSCSPGVGMRKSKKKQKKQEKFKTVVTSPSYKQK